MARKLALLIGNANYHDPELSKLNAPSVDIDRLAASLQLSGTGFYVESHKDEAEAPLTREIEAFFLAAEKDDLLLLYFSGHGVRDDNGSLYLAVQDTQMTLLSSTAIPAEFVRQQMERSRSRRQILILDCCFSGAVAPEAISPEVETTPFRPVEVISQTTFEASGGYAREVLTASTATQRVPDALQIGNTARNSLFTHFLIEGLATGQADRDGDSQISVKEWFEYAQNKVIKSGTEQTPRRWSYERKGPPLIIAQYAHAGEVARVKSQPTPSLPTSVYPLTIATPIQLELIHIPAGIFLMGVKGDGDRDEKPQHQVYLSEYCIGKYPVTNAQYAAFVQQTGHPPPRHFQNGVFPPDKANHPVVYVSWDDAMAFCRWLSDETDQHFFLPTEAEWERAARGDEGRIYSWGDTWDPTRLNGSSKADGTTPVGAFSPRGDSPFGLADVLGNVWEWCADCFDKQEYTWRNFLVQNPPGPPNGDKYEKERVRRGGPWWDSVDNELFVRCSFRWSAEPSEKYDDGGFRVVMKEPAPSTSSEATTITPESPNHPPRTPEQWSMLILSWLLRIFSVGVFSGILLLFLPTLQILAYGVLIGGSGGVLASGWTVIETRLTRAAPGVGSRVMMAMIFGILGILMILFSLYSLHFHW